MDAAAETAVAEPVRLLKTKRRPSSRKISHFQTSPASVTVQSPLIDSGVQIEPPMSQRSSPIRSVVPEGTIIVMEEVEPEQEIGQENSKENNEDDDEFDDSKRNVPGGSWVSKVRNKSIRGSLIVTTAAVRLASSTGEKDSVSFQEDARGQESQDSLKSKESAPSTGNPGDSIQIHLRRTSSPPKPPQIDKINVPFKTIVKRQSIIAVPAPQASPSPALVAAPVPSPVIRPVLDPTSAAGSTHSKIQARKASAFPSLNIFNRGGRESVFTSSVVAASPPKLDEEIDSESAFVLSRLDKSSSLDLTPASSASESTWGITGQLQSAFQALKDNLVGDYLNEGEIDWGELSLVVYD